MKEPNHWTRHPHKLKRRSCQHMNHDFVQKVLCSPAMGPLISRVGRTRFSTFPFHCLKPICEQVLDHMVLVTEHEVRAAMASLALVDHIVAEGAGAVAAAAMKKLGQCGRKVAVITGGNVDPDVLSQVLSEPE